jgi:hypothetical protein
MIRTSGRVAALWAIVASTIFASALPAFSQAPTDAQRSAIRSACRSDYIAHCSSVPPGGMASLQCLQKNMSSLSSSCQTAVRAVEAPAEPKAEAKPETKPEAKPEAKSEAAPATSSATPAEKPAVGAAPAPKAAASAPAKKPRSARAAAPAEGSAPPAGGAPTDTATATPGAAAAVAPMVLRPMRPREVLFVLRSACGGDVRALCADVPPGGGRIVQCLAAQAASLSTDCHNVLGSFAQ